MDHHKKQEEQEENTGAFQEGLHCQNLPLHFKTIRMTWTNPQTRQKDTQTPVANYQKNVVNITPDIDIIKLKILCARNLKNHQLHYLCTYIFLLTILCVFVLRQCTRIWGVL